jgi:hypothetical protein
VLEGWDDEQLLAALREAMRSRQDVPVEFIEMGKNAYAWRDIDAELAQLTYDSCHEPSLEQVASTRSENASIRALTFTSAQLSLEVEVAEDSLLGQVIPPRAGTLETQTRAGVTVMTVIDEIGCFAVAPIPAGPFRLHCRTDDGADVLTGWITLLANPLPASPGTPPWPAGRDRRRPRAGRGRPTRRGSGLRAGSGAGPP